MNAVESLALKLGLQIWHEVKAGRRIWGTQRKIDLVLIDPKSKRSLGVECRFQAAAEPTEKIPATISDIAAWPIPGIVVFVGQGFTENMRSYLISTGRAVEFEDLENWLRLFFGLPLPDRD